MDEELTRRIMYVRYLKVQSSKKGGNGTFTTIQIPANSAIMEITGPIRLDREIPPEDTLAMYLQVGPNTYIGLSGGADDFLNHSCDPNCKLTVVGNRAILYSLYVIPAGSELTFDYSSTSTDTLDKWKMDCSCGSYKCRKVISGFQYLDAKLQEEYKQKGMVPMYITNPGLIQKQ